MMSPLTGLHHVTVIAGDPQENLDFYAGVLGMRLVKRTVNQDVPGTYHLFYADAVGHPGTDLTFFSWPEMASGRRGVGLTVEVALAVRPGTLGYWSERLSTNGVSTDAVMARFSESVLPFTDPHGLALTLVETADTREFTPWDGSPVSPEYQILGLHAVRLLERNLAVTAGFLTDTLGFVAAGQEAGWHRFTIAAGGSGRTVDVQEAPNAARGAWGTGSVHHVAWRLPDTPAAERLRDRVAAAGHRPTDLIDRFWFTSVYFKEPGGALFEAATEGPGFAIDEPVETLGSHLVLPPWLEPQRASIEATLPPIRYDAGGRLRSE